MKNRLTASLLLLAILFFVCGCKPSISENKPQRDLALKVADYIEEYFWYVNYSYKYQILCKNSVEGLDSSDNPKEQSDVVPEGVKSDIAKYSKNGCNPDIKVLSSFFELLKTHLKQYKDELVLIIQFPWESGKDQEIENLAKQLDKIEGKEKIKKVFIFGLRGESPKTMQIFRSLTNINAKGHNEKTVSSAINELADDIDKDPNSKKYTVLTLFIPADTADGK